MIQTVWFSDIKIHIAGVQVYESLAVVSQQLVPSTGYSGTYSVTTHLRISAWEYTLLVDRLRGYRSHLGTHRRRLVRKRYAKRLMRNRAREHENARH